MIDLRSDTLTKPSQEMKQVMMNAPLGDDVFGEDTTVNLLENKLAKMFGKEAALFCASGTMTNQIAIKVHTKPGDDIICSYLSHIYQYEGGGIAVNSGCSTSLIHSGNGIFEEQDVIDHIYPDDIHKPISRLLSVENTCNKGGGSIWEIEQMKEVVGIARQNDLVTHLDGARFFNAHVEVNYNLVEIGELFDSISICLSKGLGAPIGSVLLGSQTFIKKARRVRKVLGGGMRQAGIIAAAGIYALDNNIDRLKTDNSRAKKVADLIKSKPYVSKLYYPESNLLIFELKKGLSPQKFLKNLKEKGVIGISMGGQLVRFVFHLDVSDNQFDELLIILDENNF
jgi:threonine aldolase